MTNTRRYDLDAVLMEPEVNMFPHLSHLIVFRPGRMLSEPAVMKAWAELLSAVEETGRLDRQSVDPATVLMWDSTEVVGV